MRVSTNYFYPDALIHCRTFGSNNILNEESNYRDGWGDSYLTILGARRKYPNCATQMTMASHQMSRWEGEKLEEILAYLKKHGFHTVSAHKNPNTNRTIYNFMAAPLGGENEESVDGEERPEIPGVVPHSGGCCGIAEIGPINWETGVQNFLKKYEKMFAEIFVKTVSGQLIQTIQPVSKTVFEDAYVPYFMEMKGFKNLFSWTDPLTKQRYNLMARSSSFETIPDRLRF